MTTVRKYFHHIGGQQVPPSNNKFIERLNPANHQLVAAWPDGSSSDVDCAVDAATIAFNDGRWSDRTGAQRAEVLYKIASLLRTEYRQLGLIECQETGKPLKQAEEEIAWSADIWEWAAGLARSVHGDSHSNLGPHRLGLVLKEPVGVVGLITPWNYPLVVLSQKLPYALAAGCSVVIKPSEMTSGTTLELARLLEASGLPAGVVNVVTGTGPVVGQRMAEHPDIRLISFTGSTATGRKIVQASSSNMKKVVLELGGKNPSVVFADADFDAAVDGAIKGFVYNAGEECCSGSRVIVERPIADRFVKAVCDKLGAIKVGDPLDPDTRMGAIISETQYQKIRNYVEDGKKCGKLVYGGAELSQLPGFFMEPTVFTDVPVTSALAREEVFGPVVTIVPFDTLDEAISIANDTQYGLAASVWSSSLTTAIAVSRRLQAGMIWVNTFMDVPSEMPIGGMKQSGYGREHGRYGLDDYLSIKSIVIQNPTHLDRYVG